MASASADKTVKIWNPTAETGQDKCLSTLEGNLGDVYAARWHPMGVSLRCEGI